MAFQRLAVEPRILGAVFAGSVISLSVVYAQVPVDRLLTGKIAPPFDLHLAGADAAPAKPFGPVSRLALPAASSIAGGNANLLIDVLSDVALDARPAQLESSAKPAVAAPAAGGPSVLNPIRASDDAPAPTVADGGEVTRVRTVPAVTMSPAAGGSADTAVTMSPAAGGSADTAEIVKSGTAPVADLANGSSAGVPLPTALAEPKPVLPDAAASTVNVSEPSTDAAGLTPAVDKDSLGAARALTADAVAPSPAAAGLVPTAIAVEPAPAAPAVAEPKPVAAPVARLASVPAAVRGFDLGALKTPAPAVRPKAPAVAKPRAALGQTAKVGRLRDRIEGDAVFHQTAVNLGDRPGGSLSVKIGMGGDLSLRLGDLLALYQADMAPTAFTRLASSSAASEFVSFEILRNAGIDIRYDAGKDQLVISPRD